MKNRITASLLALLMMVGLISCSTDPSPDSTIDSTPAVTTSPETTDEETTLSDSVPALDFGGTDFNILMRTEMAYEFQAESETAEPVNDAVYRRNDKIARRFNIIFHMIDETGSWETQSTFLNKIKNNVSSGDDVYNLIAGYSAYIAELAADGYYYNWHDINYIDFTAPWWNRVLIDEVEINDTLYFMTGDLAISGIQNAICLFYNKQLWEDYNFENPYELVRNGEWTIDRMQSFTTQAYRDLDSDGVASEGDQYGYVTDSHNLVDAYQAALEAPALRRDADGTPTLNVQSEKFLAAYDKIFDLLITQKSTYTGFDQADSPNESLSPHLRRRPRPHRPRMAGQRRNSPRPPLRLRHSAASQVR